MKSKKTKIDYPKPIKKLEKQVKQLAKQAQSIIKEHDSLRLGGDDSKISNWFFSMPIETLSESLNHDLKKPREKYSLKDLVKKFNLRKQFIKKQQEMDKYASELVTVKVEFLLDKISKIGTET
jgi:hypothetical protein